jgi:hypothetical protein
MWDKLKQPPPKRPNDFWDGSFIRTMLGPDGFSLYREVPDGEARLAFALAVDWFNPYHNKAGGKVSSSGVVFLTCLNLPIEERYKEENILLLGVLPAGAHQSQVNDILRPFIDDLLQYWNDGKIFVGEFGNLTHILVQIAICQLIADAPAARAIGGFPGHAATYACSACKDNVKNMYDLEAIMDLKNARTRDDHLQHAAAYRQVLEEEGLNSAEKLVKGPDGVRWSVLNLLPYWDPIKCTIVDCMHCILLGICQRHWRRVWDADLLSKSRPNAKDDAKDDAKELDEAAGHADGSVTSLSAEAMFSVRLQWVNGNEAGINSLTIPQILALMGENKVEIPPFYEDKDELLHILMVRHTLSYLKN